MTTVEGRCGSRAAMTVDAASAARGGDASVRRLVAGDGSDRGIVAGDGSVRGLVAGDAPCGRVTGRASEPDRDRRVVIVGIFLTLRTLSLVSSSNAVDPGRQQCGHHLCEQEGPGFEKRDGRNTKFWQLYSRPPCRPLITFLFGSWNEHSTKYLSKSNPTSALQARARARSAESIDTTDAAPPSRRLSSRAHAAAPLKSPPAAAAESMAAGQAPATPPPFTEVYRRTLRLVRRPRPGGGCICGFLPLHRLGETPTRSARSPARRPGRLEVAPRRRLGGRGDPPQRRRLGGRRAAPTPTVGGVDLRRRVSPTWGQARTHRTGADLTVWGRPPPRGLPLSRGRGRGWRGVGVGAAPPACERLSLPLLVVA